jgi:hypothetical protein
MLTTCMLSACFSCDIPEATIAISIPNIVKTIVTLLFPFISFAPFL